jgi:hypothetical protein
MVRTRWSILDLLDRGEVVLPGMTFGAWKVECKVPMDLRRTIAMAESTR